MLQKPLPRILKIDGAIIKPFQKERFNEDAESVAKSIRDDISSKLKYNLITCGLQPNSLAAMKAYTQYT